LATWLERYRAPQPEASELTPAPFVLTVTPLAAPAPPPEHPGSRCDTSLHRDLGLWEEYAPGRLTCVHPGHFRRAAGYASPTGAGWTADDRGASAGGVHCRCGTAVWRLWRHILLCARCGARAPADLPLPSRPRPYYAHRRCATWCFVWSSMRGWVPDCHSVARHPLRPPIVASYQPQGAPHATIALASSCQPGRPHLHTG
jgi:hypothetical protein